jgi:hypothetical protein
MSNSTALHLDAASAGSAAAARRYCLRCREELPADPARACACCRLPFDPDVPASWSSTCQLTEEPAERKGLRGLLPRIAPRDLMHALARRFPRNPQTDRVSTEMPMRASPAAVWDNILFYEEVTHEPPLLLRWTLPIPVRSEGRKSEVGDVVRCVYRPGFLIKRITEIERGRLTRFEVLKQDLRFQSSVTLGEGSYEIVPEGPGRCRVVLTTAYSGHLRPRFLWKPIESRLAHLLHRHVLRGMRRRAEEPVSRATLSETARTNV